MDASLAPSHLSLPPPDPAPHPSKRKWSPCTWRYAIEETQPELGSKPRRDANYILSSSSGHHRERERASELPHKRHVSSDEGYGAQLPPREQILPPTHSLNRLSTERSGIHKKQGPKKDSEEVEDGRKKNAANHKKPVQRDGEDADGDAEERVRRKLRKKEAMRRRAEDAGKRCDREMSPSELYFCEICSGRASNGGGSPRDYRKGCPSSE